MKKSAICLENTTDTKLAFTVFSSQLPISTMEHKPPQLLRMLYTQSKNQALLFKIHVGLNVCICEEELANVKGLKLPCRMRWLSWASATQKCHDEFQSQFLGAKFQLVKTTVGDLDYSSTSVRSSEIFERIPAWFNLCC